MILRAITSSESSYLESHAILESRPGANLMWQSPGEDPLWWLGPGKDLLLGCVTLFPFCHCSHQQPCCDCLMPRQAFPMGSQMLSIRQRSHRGICTKLVVAVKLSQGSLRQAQPKCPLAPAAAAPLIKEAAFDAQFNDTELQGDESHLFDKPLTS